MATTKHIKPTAQETLHAGESALQKVGARPRPITLMGKRDSKHGDFPVEHRGEEHPDPVVKEGAKTKSASAKQTKRNRKAGDRMKRNKGRV